MYTSVYDGDVEYQIKTGWDDLAVYRLGDRVDWRIERDEPGSGTLLDGVYWGCAYPKAPDAWVVIKDHHIAAIMPMRPEENQYAELVAEWRPVEWERSWWTDAAWQAHAKREVERHERLERDREESRCKLQHEHTSVCILRQMYPNSTLKRSLYGR